MREIPCQLKIINGICYVGFSYYEKFGSAVQNIDDEIPFAVYTNCEFVRLSSVLELLSGRDLNLSEYNADGYGIPYITGASNFSKGTVCIERWTTSPRVITKPNDILITCKGTVGEIAINNFGDAHIARQIMAIRNPYGLNNGYIKLHHFTSFFEQKMPHEILRCIISLLTKLYERSDLIRQTYYTTANI